MKIKDGFVKQQLGDKTIVVSAGELTKEFHGMIELNYTAADIWDWLSQGYTGDEMAKLMVKKYNIDHDKAWRDIQNITNKLLVAGILENN